MLNTKTNQEYDYSVSEFVKAFDDDIQHVNSKLIESNIFEPIEDEGGLLSVPDLNLTLEYWDSLSPSWTSPRGILPIYKFIEYQFIEFK